MTISHRIRAVLLVPAVALAASGALSACGSSTATSAASTAATAVKTTGTSAAKATGQAGQLTVTDPWVKAAETGMTGAFMVVKNSGTTDLQIVSASSPASSMMQLHETVMDAGGAMKMQEKSGGFSIKAGATHEFKPGGDHIMFMGLGSPLKSGTTTVITLKFADGSTLPVTAEVRTFSGAKETYVPGATTGSNPMATMTSHG